MKEKLIPTLQAPWKKFQSNPEKQSHVASH
jgi:hypothetical protein